MAICSYLVFPKPGTYPTLTQTLTGLSGCNVRPAENRDDVMVLVTETDTKEEESILQDTLKDIQDIQCLVLTFGEVQHAS
ncbi:MAG: hypothetical protein ACO36I_22165 [Candidatus Latescibacterota bacterium]